MEASKIMAVSLPRRLGGTAWDYSGARRFGEGGCCAGAGASASAIVAVGPNPSRVPTLD